MQREVAPIILSTALSAVVLAACGADTTTESAGSGAGRVIEVAMTEMAYTPGSLSVSPGETVTFRFRNDGAVRHEALVGTSAQQDAHHAEMAEMGSHDGMDMGSMPHDDIAELHAVVVEPGETVEMMHTFTDGDPMMIGCHEPGHWEAGMRMSIDVG